MSVASRQLACGRCRGLVVSAWGIGDDGSTVQQARCLCCGWYSRGLLLTVYRRVTVPQIRRDERRFGRYQHRPQVAAREYRRARRRADPQRVG